MSLDAFRISGGSLDDLIGRVFGGDPFAGRPVERVDLSRLLSTDSRQLLQRAAEQAAAWGYLNVEHLLWAAAQSDPTRRILDASGADPDDLARQIEAALRRGRPREDTPPLAPAAKRALLASAGPVLDCWRTSDSVEVLFRARPRGAVASVKLSVDEQRADVKAEVRLSDKLVGQRREVTDDGPAVGVLRAADGWEQLPG